MTAKKSVKLLLFILLAMLSITMVSCKKDDDNGGGGDDIQDKQITLTYAAWGNAEVENKMIEAFEAKHKNIDVIFDTTITGTGVAFTESLVTASQAGMLPDVFVTDNVPTVIDKGLVYDVAEYWNKDADAQKVYSNIASTAVYGGKRLAVPSYQFVKGILVNKTLLTKLGIDIPAYDWTWDEFYEICEDVNSAGKVEGKPVFALNGYNGNVDFEKAMAPQDDSTIGYDTWNGTQFNYLNESWLKYRRLTKSFYDTGLLEQLTPEEKNDIYGQTDAFPFGEGQVAFGVEGSWQAGTWVDNFENKNIDVEFYPYPAGTNGQKEPVILDYMCVSSLTSYPAEAFELLKWMSFGHDGWEARLKIMLEESTAIDRYPVADYPDIWEDLLNYMESTDYEGMTETIKIIDQGVPDCDKWLPGYTTFWNYVSDSSEEKGWYTMEIDQLAREWSDLLNEYVSNEYERLQLER